MIIGSYAIANVYTGTLVLPSSTSSANYRTNMTRSGNYSYVGVKINSVYPTNGGTDNYYYANAAIFSASMLQISNKTLINESSSGYTNISITEGYLNNTAIGVGFYNYYSGKNTSVNYKIDTK